MINDDIAAKDLRSSTNRRRFLMASASTAAVPAFARAALQA